MANWYVSSVDWNALPQWAASHAYIVGDIIRPLTGVTAGTFYALRASAITTGISGASQPTWPIPNNGTVVDGGVTWTQVSGQSAFGWTAAAGTIDTMLRSTTIFLAIGDDIFIGSDHSETGQSVTGSGLPLSGAGEIRLLSVNRAGSVPPVAADLLAGATRGMTTPSWVQRCPTYWFGVVFSQTGGWQVANTNQRGMTIEDCSINATGQGSTAIMTTSAAGGRLRLINTPMIFGATGQSISIGNPGGNFEWFDTPSALSGTLPTALFNSSIGMWSATLRGVDLSALGSGKSLVQFAGASSGTKLLFDSCSINPAVTRITGTPTAPTDIVELINCADGSGGTLNERYTWAGSVVTERTIVLTGGAEDDLGLFSHKIVTGSTYISFNTVPMEGFTMETENTVIGSAQTATVEIISSQTLTNRDVVLVLQYQGTSGSSLASFVSSAPANVLTAPSNLPSSSATWASSPATPQKQFIQVSFTAQVAGRIRGTLCVGKASTTVYYNPSMAIA